MESTTKSIETHLPFLNELLGGSNSTKMQTVDISFDTITAERSVQTQYSNLLFSLGDTQSEWARSRSSLKPVTGDWIQPIDELMESLQINQLEGNQELGEAINNLSLQLGEHFDGLSYQLSDTAWVIGQQSDPIDDKLELVESRIEDRQEDRLLRLTLAGLGLVCLLTFGAIVYSLRGQYL